MKGALALDVLVLGVLDQGAPGLGVPDQDGLGQDVLEMNGFDWDVLVLDVDYDAQDALKT